MNCDKKLYVAIITPFLKNLEIDYPSFYKLIDKLISDKIDGIIVSGTTGEASTLNNDEKIELFTNTVKHINNKIEVWAGVGSNNTSETISLIKNIEHLNVTGLMLVTPYYNCPNKEGLFQHFYTIAKSTNKLIMLYNIPKRSGVELDGKIVIKLANTCQNIVALKQASMNDKDTLEIMTNTNLLIYSGDDCNLLDHLNLGMDGIVSVVGHLYSYLIKQIMFKHSFNIDCISENKQLKDISLITFLNSSPSDIKYMLSYYHFCEPYVRLPLSMLDEDQRKVVDSFLAKNDG